MHSPEEDFHERLRYRDRVSDIPADARILDVREDYEWVAGHAEGALHIPLDQLPARLDELDPDEDLYVICRTGGRSFRAAQWLVGQGYSAVNVAGGMDQWLETGKPLVSDNGLKPVVSSSGTTPAYSNQQGISQMPASPVTYTFLGPGGHLHRGRPDAGAGRRGGHPHPAPT